MKTLRAVVEVTIYDDENGRKVTCRAEKNDIYWNQKTNGVRVGVVKITLPEFEFWEEVQ